MASRKVLVGIGAVVVIVIVAIGGAWALGGFGRPGTFPPPPTSPVTVMFSCTHATGKFLARVTNVSAEKSFGDYKVSLLNVTAGTKIVNNATVRKFYIGGNGAESLFYDDNDADGTMSVSDDFWVGSYGPGPYDVTLYWGANGAKVTTERCA